MKKPLILVGFLALAPFAKGQLLLEALEGEIPFTPSEKCLERVKDKYYGDGDHNFIYCAVMGPGNKKWLNLNLGSEYAREGSEYFNPEAVPVDDYDWKAFGSLYNYNRDSDGHELVQYRQGTRGWEVKHKNGYTANRPKAGEKSNIVATVDTTNDFWESGNNPCPNGYELFDATVMKETVGYSFQGIHEGVTIVKHPAYKNWTLVTAPVWSKRDEEMYGAAQDNYKTTSSTINLMRLGGTSGLWRKGEQQLIVSERKYVYFTVYNYNQQWVQGLSAEERGKQPYLDRGYYDKTGKSGDLGIGYTDAAAAAVRCIEK